MQEARTLGITPRGLQWADSDGSGTLVIPELLRVLKQVTFRKRPLENATTCIACYKRQNRHTHSRMLIFRSDCSWLYRFRSRTGECRRCSGACRFDRGNTGGTSGYAGGSACIDEVACSIRCVCARADKCVYGERDRREKGIKSSCLQNHDVYCESVHF